MWNHFETGPVGGPGLLHSTQVVGAIGAWDVARRAAEAAGVELCELTGLDDADRIRDVIEQVWGSQVLPRELIRAFQHAGVVLHGACTEGRMVGFVLGFPGLEGGLHLHSHMLAALPRWQSRGVGFALKLAQRAVCLDHGIEEVRWTYDPLVARNARFNLAKLGAVGTRLLEAHYGEMTDRLNAGDRSDRFEVRWLLPSDRVRRALAARWPGPAAGPVVLRAAGDPERPEPEETGRAPEPGAVVEIPTDHFALRREDPALGRLWRDAAARSFGRCFRAGLQAVWFTRGGSYIFDLAQEQG